MIHDDRPVRKQILEAGMRGLFTLPQLRDGQISTAPEHPGLYTVWRIAETPPRFARRSTAGHYKGEDPTLSVEALEARWVPDAALLYVGSGASIRTRVRMLMDFAAGKPVAHADGRALWQLADSDELLVAWILAPDPAEAKAALLATFAEAHGQRLPFGNELKAPKAAKRAKSAD